MSKKRKSDFLIIIIFLLGLYLPSLIFYCFCNGEETNLENRELAKFPSFTNITKIPKEIEDYYNDHLPFRNLLRQTWNNVNYLLFHTSVQEQVIVGKKDEKNMQWLFFSDKNAGDPIGDITGYKKFTPKELREIADQMQENTENLKKQGIALYYLLIPNKSSVYQEYLPNNIGIIGPTRMSVLNEYLQSLQVKNYLCVEEILKQGKEKYPTYYRTDTHWTAYGAYISMVELVKKMDKKVCKEKCEEFNKTSKEVTKLKKESMDLKKLLGVSLEFVDEETDMSQFLANVKIEFKEKKYGTYNILEAHSKNAYNSKKVLFIGDSFRKGTYDILPKMFTDVVYIHVEDYQNSLLKEYNPDIIVYEVVERYIKRLQKNLT